MAAGDWWGFGLGQGQQPPYGLLNGQIWQQQCYTAGTAGVINIGTVQMLSPAPAVKAKGPETAIEWLDRRVDEMRVSL